jgi:alpha-L-fucosidase
MYQPKPTAGDTAWFTRDRFGMFIHWGTYAAAARHEWVQNREKIPGEHYQKYFDHFDPNLYDPKAWARAAREAGMKYFVITTKHHEGFCLWDSQFTDYKATNTPHGKDLLTPLVEAFRAEGLRVGFYYSLLDWHHPHFPIDHIHPLREHPDAAKMNESRDVSVYAEYMRNQVRELLTQFGPVDILWFDFSYPGGDPKNFPHFKGKGRDDWESEKLMKLIRELAPTAMVNNRLDLPDVPADMHTPEQYQPKEWIKVDGEPVVWEACQTLSGSWGYHRDESTWKSPEQLIQMLIDTVSKGGNLLMNIGPTARGAFDYRALDALKVYADWIKWNARSIYGCTQSEYSSPADVRYTQNGTRLYVHTFAWPFRHLHLPELGGKVEYAQFLHDASEIPLDLRDWTADQVKKESGGATLTLELPIVKPNVVVPVIELFLK